jgi:peptidoglycan/LPS O-acetylase OafA/YrhL
MTSALGKHIRGLDTLRFYAALWVVMTHCGSFPLTAGRNPTNKIAWAVNGLYGGSINGPAAVILFFIISGFCIHYPFRAGYQTFELRSFLVRRFARVLIPMFVALLIARLAGAAKNDGDWFSGVPAWSLVAEIIYYSLYPILRQLSQRFSWKAMCVAAYVPAVLIATTVPVGSTNYVAIGGAYVSSWILGLPCWLLGVVLAEKMSSPSTIQVPSLTSIWAWRLGGIAIGAVLHNLALQNIIGQHWTLNVFAVYGYFWIKKEILFYSARTPVAANEWAGRWSYSLYLMHISANHVFIALKLPAFGYVADWALKMVFILTASYAFYLLLEKPSHQASRFLASLSRGKRKSPVPVST